MLRCTHGEPYWVAVLSLSSPPPQGAGRPHINYGLANGKHARKHWHAPVPSPAARYASAVSARMGAHEWHNARRPTLQRARARVARPGHRDSRQSRPTGRLPMGQPRRPASTPAGTVSRKTAQGRMICMLRDRTEDERRGAHETRDRTAKRSWFEKFFSFKNEVRRCRRHPPAFSGSR